MWLPSANNRDDDFVVVNVARSEVLSTFIVSREKLHENGCRIEITDNLMRLIDSSTAAFVNVEHSLALRDPFVLNPTCAGKSKVYAGYC